MSNFILHYFIAMVNVQVNNSLINKIQIILIVVKPHLLVR